MKRTDLKELFATVRKRYLDESRCGMVLTFSLADISDMLSSNKPILVEYPDNFIFKHDAIESLGFYLALQVLRGHNIGISDLVLGGDSFSDSYSNSASISEKLRDTVNQYVSWMKPEIGLDGPARVCTFWGEDTSRIRSICNDIVFMDSPRSISSRSMWESAMNVRNYIKSVNASDRNLIVLSFGDDAKEWFHEDVYKDFLKVGYSKEMRLIDDWVAFSGRKTFIDPQFEMEMMGPGIDPKKVFQCMGTKYPSRLRSYLRFDRKFVNQYLSDWDLKLFI